MEKVIIGRILPTMPTAHFMIYNGVQQIDDTICPINSIAKTVFELSKKHNTYKIQLSGPHSYVEKFVEEIADKEFLKYNYNKLDIQLI